MKQIRKNLVTNILCLLSNAIVGLLYTPYLVRELGVVAYGVLPLALVINQYIIILTDSLHNSVTRFYSVSYRSGDYHQASVFFSSAIAITLLLPLCVLPLIIPLLPQVEAALHIPNNLYQSAGILIIYTISSLFISLTSNCVNITIYSENRLDLINYLKIVRNLSKLFLNVLLFVFLSIDISNVGLSSVTAELLVLSLSIVFYKSTRHRDVKFGIPYIKPAAMKPVLRMLTWVSLMSLSSVFIYKVDTLFINNYFGLYYTGVLGSMSEFGAYCISITGLIGILYRPLMLIAYSERRHEDLVRISTGGAYISGLLSSLLCGVVMGLSSSLISIWLNDEIAEYSHWLVIKMILIPITTFGSTFGIVNNLWNKVREAALWSLVIAILYVLGSMLLLEMGIGATEFLVIGALTAIIQGTVIHILIYRKQYPDSMKTIYVKLVRCCLFFALVFILSKTVDSVFQAKDLFSLLFEVGISMLLALSAVPMFIHGDDIDSLDIVFPIKTCIVKYKTLIKRRK